MMTFTATLTCGRCKAALRFENERPEWKTYDYRIEEADECEKSARFVAENADKPLPGLAEPWPEYEAAVCPQFLGQQTGDRVEPFGKMMWSSRNPTLALFIPTPYRYVDCPVCDAQVREPTR